MSLSLCASLVCECGSSWSYNLCYFIAKQLEEVEKDESSDSSDDGEFDDSEEPPTTTINNNTTKMT